MDFDTQGDQFPATRHSVIQAAQSDDPGRRDQAMAALAAGYWKPVYKYLRVRWGVAPEDARDLTQEFFARLIEKQFLDSYDPAKGRLRTFVRTCVDRLHLNQSRDARRQKRGGDAMQIPLDFEEAEQELAGAGRSQSPEDYFEKEWVRTLFALAVDRLRSRCEQSGKTTQFQIFERYDLAEHASPPSYADLASDFGLAATDVTNYLAFARREFRRCVLEQLREMTGSDEEFRREAQSLLGVNTK